ncbi:MAG: hypothetical protein VKP70_07940 [Cyanobacteriota bacterium]|nr:hypothetical protein [Cyanobacteriota bacterium]
MARSPLSAFGRWLADMLRHAFGDPREEALHQPPMVGVQPFLGTIHPRRRGRLFLGHTSWSNVR